MRHTHPTILTLALLLTLTLVLSGCSAPAGTVASPDAWFAIAGDVGSPITVKDYTGLTPEKVTIGDKSYEGVPLSEVLALSEPEDPARITFIGADRHTARIDAADLTGSYLVQSAGGWEFVSTTYPINTWIRQIKTLVVESGADYGVPVINRERTLARLSPGRLLAGDHAVVFYTEGESSRLVEGKAYTGTVVTQHSGLRVRDIPDLPEGARLLAVGLDGSENPLTGDDFLEARGNRIYLNRFDHSDPIPLAGIVADPPAARVSDVYAWARAGLAKDERMLVIYIDGLGYRPYLAAAKDGDIPHLTKAPAAPAMSVFTPVTNCGFAAMLTGVGPDQNGIHSRQDRIPLVPTILDDLAAAGKKGAIVEGHINILQLNGEVALNTDRNADGFIDDDTMVTAKKYLAGDYDYIMVHFHSLDDAGHRGGPEGAAYRERLRVLDEYTGELLALWPGRAVVISDHGMHAVGEAGSHGEFRAEDMFVPFITYDGAKKR